MQFRSFRRRGMAAFASGALAVGALAAPVLFAAPAQAATFDSVAFTCTGFGGFTYTTNVDLTAKWDKVTGRAMVSAELADFPNGAPPFVTEANQAQSATLKVKVDGAGMAVSLTGSTTANFQGGAPINVPTLTGQVSAKAESLSVVIQDFTLVAGASTFPCAPATVPAAAVIPITFPTGSDLNYVCSFGANKFGYQTDATVTAVDLGPKLQVKVQLENMPNTAPVFISFPNATHASTLGVSVNGGSSVDAVGSSTANFTGGTPVAIPPVSVDVTSTATSAAVTAGNFKLVVNGTTEIPCALAAPVALPSVTATVAGPSAACTKAQGDVTAAQAAVKAAETKVKKDQAKVKQAKAKVKKAKAKVKKAAKAKKAKAKKALKATQKALKAATSTLTADTKKHGTAKTALTSATNAVTAAC